VVAGARPDVVVNCGAFTQVDRCETEAELAMLINGTAVGWLADACEAQGAMLIQISTDYVFDGTGTRPYREDDPVNPVSVYGRTKLEGERQAAALFPAPDRPHQLALRCLGQELPEHHAERRCPGEIPAGGGRPARVPPPPAGLWPASSRWPPSRLARPCPHHLPRRDHLAWVRLGDLRGQGHCRRI
jgi:hypothetical protein